jgi:hypothetical protein
MLQFVAVKSKDPCKCIASLAVLLNTYTQPALVAGLPATALASTVIELLPKKPMKKTLLGWVRMASQKLAPPPVLGPLVGGQLIVTPTPPTPFVNPLRTASAWPAFCADVTDPL